MDAEVGMTHENLSRVARAVIQYAESEKGMKVERDAGRVVLVLEDGQLFDELLHAEGEPIG
jgi:hypothetical protein